MSVRISIPYGDAKRLGSFQYGWVIQELFSEINQKRAPVCEEQIPYTQFTITIYLLLAHASMMISVQIEPKTLLKSLLPDLKVLVREGYNNF